MTDREMLQLAAKAAGIPTSRLDAVYDCWDKQEAPVLIRSAWNPLTDDGDAFRLANSLQMNVDFCCYRVVRGARIDVIEDAEHGLPAIRRAIVRAAAEIGKGMK